MVIEAKPMLARRAANKSVFDRSYQYQVLATITVHLMTFSHGIGVSWLSPILRTLQSSSDTPIGFTVSIAEASWIGSLLGLGSLAGNIIFGVLLNRLGRKWCMYLLALPYMLFWVLVFCAQSVEYLYIARFLGGITGGGSYVVMPIFISEIADSNIRGALSSMAMFFLSFGVLVGFVLSSYLDYYHIPCIVVTLPVVYLVAASLLPETPQYLLRSGQIDEAQRSYNFYKNLKSDASSAGLVRKEFEELKESILRGSQSEPVTLKDFCSKTARRAFLTAFVLMALNQFSGSFAFINYMSYIFQQSGSPMDPNSCTIIMGLVQILGTYMATVLVDRYGRKLLMLISASGMAMGMMGFGAFAQFASADDLVRFNWLPLVLMTFVIFIGAIGVISLVFVIIVETMPAKIRSSATSICMASMSCMVFVSLKLYPIVIYSMGIAFTMYSCAGVCVVCLIYLALFLKETKGKSMDFD